MKTIKPVLGTTAGLACLMIWTSVSVSDYLAAADESKPAAKKTDSANVDSLIENLAYGKSDQTPDPEVATIENMTQEVVKLSDMYNSGEITCQACLTQVDSCIQTLQSDYSAVQSHPQWQQSYDQLVDIRSDLPCCGNTPLPVAGGESVVPGSEVVTSETVISQDPLPTDGIEVPCPVAAPPLAPAPAPFAPPQEFVSGGFVGGGGGGGFGGGGALLGLAGAGLGVAALIDDDDSPQPRDPATPTR